MTLLTDVLVVGAGPAGAAAAAHVAGAGLKTLVVDKAEFPRDKCCGDGLTALALRELEGLGLQPTAVESWHRVSAATIRSPSGRERVFPLPDSTGCYAAVARRIDLDYALVEVAQNAGATVIDRASLQAAALASDGTAVHAQIKGYGSVTARWVIGADGMWSALRKALGLNLTGYRGEWHAFRQYFHNLGPRADELTVWFEPDLLPGYAWSFPLGHGQANIGFGIHRGGRHSVGSMNRLWQDLLTRSHIQAFLGPDAEPGPRRFAWPIPARVGRLPLTGPRTLFAGDAAGMCDPLTGEGIGQALLSGRLAAEAIITHNQNDYDQAVSARLHSDDTGITGLSSADTGTSSAGLGSADTGVTGTSSAGLSSANAGTTGTSSAGLRSTDAGTTGTSSADTGFAGVNSVNSKKPRTAESSVCSDYSRRIKAELVADDRMSRLLIPLLSQLKTANSALWLAGATNWTRRNFARWMFEDYPRALMATPRRWHRGALRPPGAFVNLNVEEPSLC